MSQGFFGPYAVRLTRKGTTMLTIPEDTENERKFAVQVSGRGQAIELTYEQLQLLNALIEHSKSNDTKTIPRNLYYAFVELLRAARVVCQYGNVDESDMIALRVHYDTANTAYWESQK